MKWGCPHLTINTSNALKRTTPATGNKFIIKALTIWDKIIKIWVWRISMMRATPQLQEMNKIETFCPSQTRYSNFQRDVFRRRERQQLQEMTKIENFLSSETTYSKSGQARQSSFDHKHFKCFEENDPSYRKWIKNKSSDHPRQDIPN